MSMHTDSDAPITVGQTIERIARAFDKAGLFFGHGTENAADESAALVFHALGLPHDGPASLYDKALSPEDSAAIETLVRRRTQSRKPLAYMLGEAWFAGLLFYVDERVLVPRSPVAELVVDGFEPWIEAAAVRSVLEVGTGSGCIAIACALAFPDAAVTATDISSEALEVALKNVERHQLAGRLQLQQADLLDGVEGVYDIIISNPPYVPESEQAVLPEEYGHEPALGLFSGSDGLDSARRILQDAPGLLSSNGILVLEVGAQWQALERAFPSVAFTWLEFERGGEGVALLRAVDLP
jgi:ribosomal protein L3 glutamine methyltransferase